MIARMGRRSGSRRRKCGWKRIAFGSLAHHQQSGMVGKLGGRETGEDPSVKLRLEPTIKKRRDPWREAALGGLVKNLPEKS